MIWKFADVLTATVSISRWGFRVWMEKFAKWLYHILVLYYGRVKNRISTHMSKPDHRHQERMQWTELHHRTKLSFPWTVDKIISTILWSWLVLLAHTSPVLYWLSEHFTAVLQEMYCTLQSVHRWLTSSSVNLPGFILCLVLLLNTCPDPFG